MNKKDIDVVKQRLERALRLPDGLSAETSQAGILLAASLHAAADGKITLDEATQAIVGLTRAAFLDGARALAKFFINENVPGGVDGPIFQKKLEELRN